MKSLGVIGGLAAVVLGATVVMAASPAPTPAPTTKPAATPAPTTAPAKAPATAPSKTSTSSTSSSTNALTWSASVSPLALQGTASFAKESNGSATLTMQMQGLAADQPWTVTVYRGSTGMFENRAVLFRWTAGDVELLGAGTLRAHLTAADFRSITSARSSAGLLIVVSDGSREAIATFAKG